MGSGIEHLYGKPWKEREYVITLHYYFQYGNAARHEESELIREIANLLGRTPASVSMRMENYTNLESNPTRRGLSNGGPLCRKIFFEWEHRRDNLAACAEIFIRELKQPHALNLFEPDDVVLPKAFQRYELVERIGEGG